MALENSDFWQCCLQIIAAQIDPLSFDAWFGQTHLVNLSENEAVVSVGNRFVAEWILSYYGNLTINAAKQVNGREISVVLLFEQDGSPMRMTLGKNGNISSSIADFAHLDKRYTFENFVVGDFNKLAYMSALAVAEKPGKTKFNPLFIHGDCGLGKTHLLSAIGCYIRKNHPNLKVIQVSADRFSNFFVDSLKNDSILRFQEIYRNANVLLVDDIQLFAGKEKTQKAFFNIFNTLFHNNQQIVLTSDSPPNKILHLDKHLSSRFQSGLMVDLLPPNFKGRIAILRHKADASGIELPDSVLSLIAQSVTSNIRQLEGLLIRLMATSSIQGREIDDELALEIIGQYAPSIHDTRKCPTLEDIARIVSQYMGVPYDSLRSKRRTKPIALGRQIAMYLARKYTGASLQMIGSFFGGRDHSTVVHACKLVPSCNGEIAHLVQQMESEIAGGKS